jgi:hypothetical protein
LQVDKAKDKRESVFDYIKDIPLQQTATSKNNSLQQQIIISQEVEDLAETGDIVIRPLLHGDAGPARHAGPARQGNGEIDHEDRTKGSHELDQV